MNITRYKPEYDQDIHRLVKEFKDESLAEYGLTYNDKAVDATIERAKKTIFCIEIDGRCEGILAGAEVKTPSGYDRCWQEIIWFVTKKHRRHGVRLLRYAQKVLKEEGYANMVMVFMHNSKTSKLYDLYTRLGFKPMETNFIRRL